MSSPSSVFLPACCPRFGSVLRVVALPPIVLSFYLIFFVLAPAPLAAQPEIPTVAPPDAPSEATLVEADEPGRALVLEGTVLGSEGEPLEGASVFLYQTGADGVYGPEGNSDPRIRGYLRTDGEGRFRVRTIKPGSYPGTRVAPHIHVHVRPPGSDVAGGEETVKEIVFEGDALVSDRMRRSSFFHVIPLEEGEGDILRGRWQLQLP